MPQECSQEKEPRHNMRLVVAHADASYHLSMVHFFYDLLR